MYSARRELLCRTVYFIKKIEQHAAHTPRKHWRCGSACTARAKPPFDILLFCGSLFNP
jgi:hypothetical protein